MSDLAFLHSICKMCFDGHGAYEKGDEKEISQWLREHHPDLAYISVGRVERSKRQDWAAEVAMKILPLLDPLNEYLVTCLLLDNNILRDSALQRMELMHFRAYVHVLAIGCMCAFNELRALTNATVVDSNPM